MLALHEGLPRQAPGSDRTSAHLLSLVGPLPEEPVVLDLGCGPGRASLMLARVLGAAVTALDTHQPFLDQLRHDAQRLGLDDRITTVATSMEHPPAAPGSVDLLWCEGAAYILGLDRALAAWRPLITPQGVVVVTEIGASTDPPGNEVRQFWDGAYPLRRRDQQQAIAQEAGLRIDSTYTLPDRDWFDEYYTPLWERTEHVDRSDRAMAQAADAARAEIELRRRHPREYEYTGLILRPVGSSIPT